MVFWFILSIIAVENLADILTSVLKFPQYVAQKIILRLHLGSPPKTENPEDLGTGLYKLTLCKYCQSWWLWIPTAYFTVCDQNVIFQCVVIALAGHRLSSWFDEFTDRWFNRAPHAVVANLSLLKNDDIEFSNVAVTKEQATEATEEGSESLQE